MNCTFSLLRPLIAMPAVALFDVLGYFGTAVPEVQRDELHVLFVAAVDRDAGGRELEVLNITAFAVKSLELRIARDVAHEHALIETHRVISSVSVVAAKTIQAGRKTQPPGLQICLLVEEQLTHRRVRHSIRERLGVARCGPHDRAAP